MIYSKKPYTKLHHTEIHKIDDGSYQVEAHLHHNPPPPNGGKVEHMVAPNHEYPNKVVKHGADDLEEAHEISVSIHLAHQHEGGKRGKKVQDDADENGGVPAGHSDYEEESD